jgi:hypothetical protein
LCLKRSAGVFSPAPAFAFSWLPSRTLVAQVCSWPLGAVNSPVFRVVGQFARGTATLGCAPGLICRRSTGRSACAAETSSEIQTDPLPIFGTLSPAKRASPLVAFSRRTPSPFLSKCTFWESCRARSLSERLVFFSLHSVSPCPPALKILHRARGGTEGTETAWRLWPNRPDASRAPRFVRRRWFELALQFGLFDFFRQAAKVFRGAESAHADMCDASRRVASILPRGSNGALV